MEINLENASKFISTSTIPKIFVPKGECRFALYNPFTDTKYPGTNDDKEIKKSSLYLESSDDNGNGYYSIPNWGGGTLTLKWYILTISNMHQELNDEPQFETWPDEAYLVGEFNDWNAYEAPEMTKVGDHFEIQIQVADPGEFKILGAQAWLEHDCGSSKFSATVGSTVFCVARSHGGNFEIPKGTWNIAFEPKRAAVWMWPAGQVADPEPDGFFSETPQLHELPPFSGIVMVTPDDFVNLLNVNLTELDIRNEFTTFECDPNASEYEFDIRLGSGNQFAFLLYDRNELVKIIDPVADTELVYSGTTAHSRITTDVNSNLSYWSSWLDGNFKVRINTADNSMNAFEVEYLDLDKGHYIYLVGKPEGWVGPYEKNADHYDSWKLRKTTTGAYYGEFNIDAGDAMFRFYTSLTNWETDSWGTQEYDVPVVCDWQEENTISRGKGAYDFSNWPGGTMYILVNLNAGWVRISDTPMDVTIDTTPLSFSVSDNLVNINDNEWFSNTSEGVYSLRIYSHGVDNRTLRLLRTKHEFSETEPEWERSYTLTFDESPLEFDELGVAEVKFTFNDGVDITEPSTLTLPSRRQTIDGYGAIYHVTVDFNTSTIYIDRNGDYYLMGTMTNGERPTYATRTKYSGARVVNNSGVIVNLPAGDITITPTRLYEEILYYPDVIAPAEPDAKGIYRTHYTESDIYTPAGLTISNYPGGMSNFGFYTLLQNGEDYFGNPTIFGYNNMYVLPLNLVNRLEAVVYAGVDPQKNINKYRNVGALSLTDASTLTFKGNVDVAIDEYNDICNFILRTDIDPEIHTGGATRYITLDGGKADYTANGGSINFANLAEGKVETAVSLSTLEGHIRLIQGESATLYTLHADPEILSMDFPAADANGNPILNTQFANLEKDTIEVNFSNSNGEILCPSQNIEVEGFDEHGCVVMPFVVTKFDGDASLATATAPKWRFKTENVYNEYYTYEPSNILFKIDREAGTVTFTYSESIESLYAIPRNENDGKNDPDDIIGGTMRNGSENAPARRLTRSSNNVYKATVYVDADAELCLVGSLHNGAYVTKQGEFYGLTPLMISDKTIDLYDGGEREIRLLPFMTTTTGIKILHNPGTTVDITYNADESMLYLSFDMSGVENVDVDCSSDAPVEYYNLQGVRVSNPGNGLYIRRQGNTATKVIIK